MRVRWGFAGAALVAALLVLGGAASRPQQAGGFTRAQAASGELVYVQYCLRCHGDNLQGADGGALQGPKFGRSIAAAKMSTPALYQFLQRYMPLNAPGTLSDEHYLDVLSFILEKNGYPPGSAPLTKASLGQVALLPYPNLAPNPVAPLTPAPSPGATVAPSAQVALDDAALLAAERDAKDWRLPGRTYSNARYSPLAQIDTGNVDRLQPVAVVHTGMLESFETTPLVADGVMYLTTPVYKGAMKIMALDAASGKTIWTASYAVDLPKLCCGPNNRGAALAYGNLYFTTLDAKLVAFDARSGTEKWETQVADPRVGYSETMAPQVYDGQVVVGSSGAEWPVRGFVAAYDAHTGKQRWRWYATDPKTFAGDSWKTGGGTVWTTPAIDPARHLVIFSTANPAPDLLGDLRKGDNLYTDCIVALDARSGKLRWYYQEVKHDTWDYDATSNVVLFDVHQGGATIPAAGQAGKTGWYYVVDRRNGKLLRKSEPFVVQNKNMWRKIAVLPGANGGSEWSPPAYSPRAGRVYVLGINQLMDFKAHPETPRTGWLHIGSIWANEQKPKKVQTGTFSAIDVASGKIAWQYKAPKPMIGGALATGGDLVFVGEGDGTFEAFDAKSGAKLWTHSLDGGVNAPPVSYEVNGTQYVAVAAGGNFQLDYKRGDEVAIFALKR